MSILTQKLRIRMWCKRCRFSNFTRKFTLHGQTRELLIFHFGESLIRSRSCDTVESVVGRGFLKPLPRIRALSLKAVVIL